MTPSPNVGDPNLTFIAGFRTTGLQGTLYVRVDRNEDLCELDDLLGWIYREGKVNLMFRIRDNKGCAMVQFTKDDCVELVRKLTKMLQEADNAHKPF